MHNAKTSGYEIFVVGGKTLNTHRKTLWIYSTISRTWRAGAPLPANWPGLENAVVVSVGETIYVIGGLQE